MGDGKPRIFCGTELAARIERLEADLIGEANEASRLRRGDDPGFAIRIAGGVASFAENGSPFNKVAFEGFAHPDGQGVPSHEDFPRDVIERAERDFSAAGVVRYVARCEGVVAGGASFRIAEGVGQLLGAATAPAYRRRGIHTALLSARLADAAAGGCDIAVVTTQPGSKSQENMQRRGFDLLYTRAVLVKRLG